MTQRRKGAKKSGQTGVRNLRAKSWISPDLRRLRRPHAHHLLGFERPKSGIPFLFLSLKGRQRGKPMTPAGLRSLFPHHRRTSRILNARPHRFRHTFDTDMIRAGISLPALMRLMGHSQIHTTMICVELSPQDVWREYHRALEKRTQDLSQLRGALSHE